MRNKYPITIHTTHPKSLDKTIPSILLSILLKTPIIKIKGKGDGGLLGLKPLKMLKKPPGDPLIKTESCTVEIQVRIHYIHFSPKPILPNKYRRASQVTRSFAFSMSNLQMTPGV